MSRYWVADLHLGHEKVAKLRGFKSTQDHDRAILKQLKKLSTGDMLWVLGDISGGSTLGTEYALRVLKEEVQAPMHLIEGNHDEVSSIHRQGFKHQRKWLEVFESIQSFGRIRVQGVDVLMSHYPYARSGDGPGRGKQRYYEYRLRDAGFPLIHGHTHQTGVHMDGDVSQFCVSWDAQRRITTERDIDKWIGKRRLMNEERET